MTNRISITNWTELSSEFSQFFDGLGAVTVTHDCLEFQSHPNHVQTGFTVHITGFVNASMPLHGLDARFERFEFKQTPPQVMCHGQDTTYTYKVPQELIAHRGESI